MGNRRNLKWKVTESGCHEPTSHKSDDGHGYPVMVRKGERLRIYRHRFEKRFGPVPAGLVVRHTCDNRKCINTDHMLLGTRADNMHDKTARGRTVKGEKNGRSILIEADAIEILKSKAKTRDLAVEYKVSCDTIAAIRAGRRWGHLQSII